MTAFDPKRSFAPVHEWGLGPDATLTYYFPDMLDGKDRKEARYARTSL